MKLLIVTAVDAERDAVLKGLSVADVDVLSVGVGPARAAAGTARLLATREYDAVINAGVAGALAGRAATGDIVLATASVSAELGVVDESGFTPLGALGFGSNRFDADPTLTAGVDGHRGEILTLATITGTAARADELATAYPDAIAEAMEGFGVATAADDAGIPFGEIRAISNAVGDRDVAGWDWEGGFAGLTLAAAALSRSLDRNGR
ncbi:futalosine hydrolase [Stackebrandtia soli]|uniref:futalosine hydrolase n=1 Tax=Stackebrandtia soli TaxID=1892856 RepID=UPI0039E8A8FE